MNREEVLRILAENREKLKPFHVKALSIFGSVARGEATDGSDVDVLVEFDKPISLFDFVGLQQYLEELLKCRVDLATRAALRECMREQILKEAIRAA